MRLVGKYGTLTIATRGAAGPGEVLLSLPGGAQPYICYSRNPIARGEEVIVFNERPGNCVDVTSAAEADTPGRT